MAHVRADANRRWSDLRKRFLTALILAPLVLTDIWIGGWAFRALVVLAGVGLALEWVRLCRGRLDSVSGSLVPLAVAAAGIGMAYGHGPAAFVILAVGVLIVIAVGSTGGWALALGVPYIGLAIISLVWLRDDAVAGRANVLFLLLLIWASDIGAYLTGRALGGPRLAPRISPSKTCSGAVGGLITAILVSGLAACAADPPASLSWFILTAALLGVIAQAGDLFESLIKRHFGVKDSGHIIPGHGGLLDRLDALLATAPVTALLALAAGPGVVVWQ